MTKGLAPRAEGVGEVTQVFVSEARDGKKAFTSVRVQAEKYTGSRGGAARYSTVRCTLVAFDERAEQLKRVREGDMIAYRGDPQASRPFKGREGDMISGLEINLDHWTVLGGAAEPAPAPAADESSESADGGHDPFAEES